MNTKTIGTLLIAGLVVLSAMVVFTGTAMAEEDDDCTRALHIDGYENTSNVGHHPNDEPVATITAQPGDTVTLRVDWWDWRLRLDPDCYRIYKWNGASWQYTGIGWSHRSDTWGWREYHHTVTATVPTTPGTYTYRIIAMAYPFADLSTTIGQGRWDNIVNNADKTWDKVEQGHGWPPSWFSTGDYEDITIVVCEPRIDTILNDTYGSGCWQESTVETFYATGTSPSYTAKALVVNTNCGYTNPTGWYDAATRQQHELWADPKDAVAVGGDTQTISPLGAGAAFGLYINSSAQSRPPGPTYYTETNQNPSEDGQKRLHAKVYEITGGTNCELAAATADFVVAFEDLPYVNWTRDCEPDYNDVVIELQDASSEPIPEFATIALPALSVLGLFLYFNRRKQRKE